MSLTDWRALHGDFFEGTTCVVTGGAGFIGSHLTEALLSLGARVRVIDDLCGGDEGNFDGFKAEAGDRLEVVVNTILDPTALSRVCSGSTYVFHQAALGSVPRSVAEPELFNSVNVTGTLNVLEAARHAKVQRVMFAASSSAYGDSEVLPKVEDMPVLPKSPYAANKVAGEALMRAYAGSYEMDTASLRYFNIFGPRQNANSAYAAVIAAFAKALIAGDHPTIFGDGEQSRDFTFVDNAVQANLLAARNEQPIGGRVLNVACGERVTVNQLAEHMARLMDRPELTPEHKEERAGDVKHSLAELSAIHDCLGYEPLVSFADGLKPTVAWYQQVMVAN